MLTTVVVEAFQMLCPGCISGALPQAQRLQQTLRFPIGIDAHDADQQPVTFSAYGMRGTPSTLLIDRDGRLRAHHFGAAEDMSLARAVTQLLHEGPAELLQASSDGGCAVDGGCS